MITAIDDFAAGHSDVNMLTAVLPEISKIDMQLTRAMATDPERRTIVAATVDFAKV